MSVRPGLPADVPALCRIASRAYRSGFASILPAEALARVEPGFFEARLGTAIARVLVAPASGTPAGFALVTPPTLDMLFVDPERAGRGLGTALLRAAEVHGATILECFARNEAAQRFYASRGWTQTGAYVRGFLGQQHEFVRLERPA